MGAFDRNFVKSIHFGVALCFFFLVIEYQDSADLSKLINFNLECHKVFSGSIRSCLI